MGFRFSIKWALAAIAYVALAAAALTQTGWAYAWLLWLVAFTAFVYAVLLACYARERRQARALGFAVASLSLAACLHLVPANLPTERLLRSFGIVQDKILFTPTPTPALSVPNTAAPVYNSYSLAGAAQGGLNFQSRGPISVAAPTTFDVEQKVRAANANLTMLAGLLGLFLGSIAFAKCRPLPDAM